jgi:hypothetical protein
VDEGEHVPIAAHHREERARGHAEQPARHDHDSRHARRGGIGLAERDRHPEDDRLPEKGDRRDRRRQESLDDQDEVPEDRRGEPASGEERQPTRHQPTLRGSQLRRGPGRLSHRRSHDPPPLRDERRGF